MQWLHKDLNNSEVLIVFKLPELSHSYSKRINDEATNGEFLDLYLKSVKENSVYKSLVL